MGFWDNLQNSVKDKMEKLDVKNTVSKSVEKAKQLQKDLTKKSGDIKNEFSEKYKNQKKFENVKFEEKEKKMKADLQKTWEGAKSKLNSIEANKYASNATKKLKDAYFWTSGNFTFLTLDKVSDSLNHPRTKEYTSKASNYSKKTFEKGKETFSKFTESASKNSKDKFTAWSSTISDSTKNIAREGKNVASQTITKTASYAKKGTKEAGKKAINSIKTPIISFKNRISQSARSGFRGILKYSAYFIVVYLTTGFVLKQSFLYFQDFEENRFKRESEKKWENIREEEKKNQDDASSSLEIERQNTGGGGNIDSMSIDELYEYKRQMGEKHSDTLEEIDFMIRKRNRENF